MKPRITFFATVRKGPKPSGRARVVRPVRWTDDEWKVVVLKAKQLRLTPSEYVRAKVLDTPARFIRWPKAA